MSSKDAGDFFKQTIYDAPGIGGEMGRRTLKRDPLASRAMKKGGVLEEPEKRVERESTEEAVKEKAEARARIKPMPDPEAAKGEERKAASRRRQRRGGRASTVLSGAKETLG